MWGFRSKVKAIIISVTYYLGSAKAENLGDCQAPVAGRNDD